MLTLLPGPHWIQIERSTSFTSVDGVGWFKPDLSKLRCKVKDGTNINVVPENYDFGDFVAFIGSKCGVPKASATTHVNA